jgi:hypothetical protein
MTIHVAESPRQATTTVHIFVADGFGQTRHIGAQRELGRKWSVSDNNYKKT